MKRLLIVITVIFSMFFIQQDIFAVENLYIALGGGSGGDSGGSNFSLDIGATSIETEKDFLMAMGLTVIDADDIPSGTLGDSIDSNFTLIGDKQKIMKSVFTERWEWRLLIIFFSFCFVVFLLSKR